MLNEILADCWSDKRSNPNSYKKCPAAAWHFLIFPNFSRKPLGTFFGVFELFDGFLQCRKITMLDWTAENVLHHSADLNQAFGTCFAFFFTFPILQTAFFGSNCIDFYFCGSFALLNFRKTLCVISFSSRHGYYPFYM